MDFSETLDNLSVSGNLRILPEMHHDGKYVVSGGRRMLNLSSNDYLGIASDALWTGEFMDEIAFLARRRSEDAAFSSSSSRLLTGNFSIFGKVEDKLASLFGKESALVFSSGFSMNAGILPAVADASTLILADKLVHASIIDGLRLCQSKVVRFRHQDMEQLERLVASGDGRFSRIIIVTESIFSMDGDVTDLKRLVELKRRYNSVMLYVDEAHAVGVRGETGLGVAQEQDCIGDVDFLCGTFGKALASVGAYLVCSRTVRDFLVNRMRTLIFTTALPPVNLLWTMKVLERLQELGDRRRHLEEISSMVRKRVMAAGKDCPSASHIIPLMAGDSAIAVEMAENMRAKGLYLLPVRPPTVPEGTSRLRISMTAAMSEEDAGMLISVAGI